MKHFLGIKKGMTQVYVDDKAIPVTIIDVPENVVCKSDVKEKSAELCIGAVAKKKATKAEQGQFKKLGFIPRFTWFVRVDKDAAKNVGDKFSVEDVKAGDLLRVTGISKSKGFAGPVKRWGYHGGPKTHGQSDRERAPGAIGAGTDPGRVLKGRRMAGRMGADKITLKNRKVVEVGENYILVKGAIPGNNGGILKITVSSK